MDPRSRGRNSVIGTIHGWPRPPIFGGPGTEHLSEYSGVLSEVALARSHAPHKLPNEVIHLGEITIFYERNSFFTHSIDLRKENFTQAVDERP
jgi:hypothetical protein